MKHRFHEAAHHTIVFGVGGVLRQAVAFLLIPLYTRFLKPDAFGALALFLVVMGLMQIVPNSFIPALFRSYYDCEEDEQRCLVVSSTYSFVLLLAGVLTAIGLIGRRFFSVWLFGTVGFESLWRIVMWVSFFNSIAAIGMTVLRAKKASWQFALVSFVSFLIQMFAVIYFVAFRAEGLTGVLYGYLIGAVANVILLFPFVIKSICLHVSFAEVHKLLIYGWPFIPTEAMGFVTQSADRIFLERFASMALVGVYSLSQKLSSIVSVLFISPFSFIALPVVFSAEQDKNAKEFYARLLTYYLLVALGVGLTVSMTADSLLRLVSTPNYWKAAKIVPLMTLSLILYGARSMIGVGLNLKRKTYYFPLAVGIGTTVNFMLLILLVPRFYEWGATWASVIGSLAVCAVNYFANRTFFPLPYEWLRMAKVFAVAVTVYGVSCALRFRSPLQTLVAQSGLWLLYPILLYFTRFFELREIQYARRSITQVVYKLRSLRELR